MILFQARAKSFFCPYTFCEDSVAVSMWFVYCLFVVNVTYRTASKDQMATSHVAQFHLTHIIAKY